MYLCNETQMLLFSWLPIVRKVPEDASVVTPAAMRRDL